VIATKEKVSCIKGSQNGPSLHGMSDMDRVRVCDKSEADILFDLDMLKNFRNEGWVDAASVYVDDAGMSDWKLECPLLKAKLLADLEWLSKAIDYERHNGKYSLLRRDLACVRAQIKFLNRSFRRLGLPERQIKSASEQPRHLLRSIARAALAPGHVHWWMTRMWRIQMHMQGRAT
jgi:hypothetical protein